MDNRRLNTVLHQLHHLAGGPAAAALTDGQLLGRFVSRRDGAAFELLVRRHGPLVWSACRRVLGSPHDADDAFQATFLVLVRRAASLDRTIPLSAWLHGVACRVALRARETAARRRRHEQAAAQPADTAAQADGGPEARDLRRLLDEELDRLPDKYRVPLVLCYLEGLTHEEAARQLGWPLGTLKGRLQRGREQLRGRLARRGLAPCAPLPAVPPPLLVPPAVVAGTLTAALDFAAGSAASASAQAVALTEGVLKAMTLSKLKTAAALLLAATFLAAGAGGLTLYARPADPGGAALVAPAPEADEPAAKPHEKDAKPPDKDAKPQEPAPVGEKLEALWADLASDDQGKAWRAAFALAAAPKDAAALFAGRLKPVTYDAERLAKLIRELDSDDFEVREKASAELKTAGEVAVPLLRKALDNNPSVEAKRRIEELLERSKGPSPAWVRSARAVAVLEAVGGDDARKLLEATAKGQADALPTRAAQAALDRLNGKPATWEAHWDALGGADEAAALRAAIAAVAAPKESLPFFKERLAKGPPDKGAAPDEKLVAKLIANLGADDFEVRNKATNDLIALGAPAVPLIRKALAAQSDPEIAKRLEHILAKVQRAPAPAPAPGIGAAGDRLIVVLAHLDTAESRELLEVVRKSQVKMAQMAVSPDGRSRVEAMQDIVRLVDVASGKILWLTKGGPGPLCVAFSPDGKLVGVGNGGGDVSLIDASVGKQIRLMRGHKAGVVGVAFSPDGKTLKSVDTGKAAVEWDLATGKKLN
jgi:RNA polymerase sigma factor (sigma-70 family)